MYCRSVLVLLSLLAATVTSQDTPACNDARNALRANWPCYNAFSGVVNAADQNTSVGAAVDLNVYCAADCRNLVNRALVNCDDDDDPDGAAGFGSLTRFICTTYANNVSCYDFINSPQREALIDAFETSGVCPDVPAGQMCSSACQTAFQNLLTDGGCCIIALLDIASQAPGGDEFDEYELLAQCPVDLSGGDTCTEIGGGATGLKAFGSILLFAIIVAVQAVI